MAKYSKAIIAGGGFLVLVLQQLGLNVCDANALSIGGFNLAPFTAPLVGALATYLTFKVPNTPTP